MEIKTISCDCGCGALATEDYKKNNWFILSQPQQKVDSYDPKLERKFHFKTLTCLETWSKKAVKVGKDLSEGAINGPRPRGSLHRPDFPGIYV